MRKYLAALVVAIAACSSVNDLTYVFQADVRPLSAAPAQVVVDSARTPVAGVVVVGGGVVTPCWNDVVRLDGSKSGLNLDVQIEWTLQQPCTDVRTRHHSYLGVFSQLRPATYHVRVVDATGAAPAVRVDSSLVVR
ncbi:MAG TPA: hypothetical protein VEW03_12435 [Longimicrobiaceae bacterium]|nr:hypothetical protein [Longimicrobiaceae bacterium]